MFFLTFLILSDGCDAIPGFGRVCSDYGSHMKIRVSIADDHPMIIDGFRNMLAHAPHITLVGTYEHGAGLLDGLKKEQPDVLILDIQMPGQNGEEIAHVVRKEYPHIRVMTLTNFDSPAYLSAMLRQGVLGYLLKTTGKDTLIKAIETVYAGEEFIEPSLKEKMYELSSRANKTTVTRIRLTDREQEVLPLIVEGYTDKEIAVKLFLSLHTVRNYRNNLLLKLDVKNTAGLIRKAMQLGLVT